MTKKKTRKKKKIGKYLYGKKGKGELIFVKTIKGQTKRRKRKNVAHRKLKKTIGGTII